MKFERAFRVRPGDLSELRPLSEWVRVLAQRLSLSARTSHDLDLCLHEAVSNIIRHGCDNGEGHGVTVCLEEVPLGIRLQIEDDARPFDPVAAPRPVEADALENARTGGYGLPLLRSMARELRYESAGGRNRLVLILESPGGGGDRFRSSTRR